MRSSALHHLAPSARCILSFGMLLQLAALPAGATDYLWFGSDKNLGGAGTWGGSNQPKNGRWRLDANSDRIADTTSDLPWTGAWPALDFPTARAVFGGTGGKVTIARWQTLQANALLFATDGFTIAPGNSSSQLELVGKTPTITVEAATATIGARLTGTAGLSKQGNGMLILTGANTYEGPTAIGAGVLSARNAGALGSSANTAATTVAAGATLELSGGVTLANAGTLVLRGAGTGTGALRSVGGDNTWSGNLALGADATFYSGTAGRTLKINSDYDANRTVTLGASTLTVDGPGDTWFNANLGVAGDTGGLVKDGAGTLTLYGYVTRYTGETKVNAGALDLVVGPFSDGYHGINGALTIGKGGGSATAAGSVSVHLKSNSYADQLSPTSAVTIHSDGILNVGSSTGLGSLTLNGGQVAIASGQTLSPARAITAAPNGARRTASITGGSLALATGGTTFDVARDLTLGSDLTITSQLTGAGGLTKNGAGILTLGTANTYTGETKVTAGVLAVNGSLARGSTVTVGTGATLAGTGRVFGPAIVSGRLSPGAFASDGASRIGTLTTAEQTWNGGAGYVWQIDHALGRAGTNWDRLALTGGLTIGATPAAPFTLQVIGLDSSGAVGTLAGFSNRSSYSWSLLTATTITGFEAGAFRVDSAAFAAANPLGGGSFSLARNGNSLDLVFTPVPEPATYALVLGVITIGFAGVRRWRRRDGAA